MLLEVVLVMCHSYMAVSEKILLQLPMVMLLMEMPSITQTSLTFLRTVTYSALILFTNLWSQIEAVAYQRNKTSTTILTPRSNEEDLSSRTISTSKD